MLLAIESGHYDFEAEPYSFLVQRLSFGNQKLPEMAAVKVRIGSRLLSMGA